MNSDKLKFEVFIKYKDEIIKDKEKYEPILLELLEKNEINHYIEEIIELWEKDWTEEPNTEIDELKFKYKNIFKKYKEEIKRDKERYKPVLVDIFEKSEYINRDIYKDIIEIWEEEWEEEANIYLKFKDEDIFKKYKDDIKENKERYKSALLELLEEDKIDFNIKKDIVNIWEKEWKEEANIYIDKLKFYYYSYYKINLFEEYKEEIGKNKERYKPALLELLEENKIDMLIYKEIIELWEEEWKEEPNIYIDSLKLRYRNIFKEYKEEIVKDKERYKVVLIDIFEKNRYIRDNIYEDIIELWEKEWKEEANIDIDKLKFYYEYKMNIFKEYKEEIIKDKERYKPVLVDIFEKNRYIRDNIYKDIIELWEKEWKEEPNIYIDKLKFDYYTFEEYKKEIRSNKERYKPALLRITEKNNCITSNIKKEIIEIWEKGWKEEPNIYIDRIKIDVDREKYKDNDIFEKYKEEIGKNKERYKPILLDILERDGYIRDDIYKEIIEIWENEWEEEPNIYIDIHIANKFYLYKEKIIKDKEKYKPILLENDKIDYYRYEELIEIWENGWKEEPIIELKKETLNLDKLKFEYKELSEKYKEEIGKNKERYKPVFLELLEEGKIDSKITKEIIEIWEKYWGEEPIIKFKKEILTLDNLKFEDDDIFEYYKEEIGKNKERYKPVFLELLEKDKISSSIYKDIIDIWENEWREVPYIYIDKLKFYYDYKMNIFKEYKKEIKRDKERYKSALLELLEKDKISWKIYEEIIEIWKKDWKEEGEIEGNSELIDIDSTDYFIENRDEIINNREKYEETVRRCFVLNTYKEIKPILNSWGDSDIELLTKLILKSTYKTYNTLYSELKGELIENKDSIIENINKNYEAELKDKTIKLFILTTVQTIDELEKKLKLLKFKDMDKLTEYLIKLNLDKDIDSEVLKNIINITIDKISSIKYIKVLIEKKKYEDNLPKNCIEILKNILDKIENKETLENLAKELRFNNPIEMLKYLRDERVPIEITNCIEVLRDIFNQIDSKEKLDRVVEEYGFNNPMEILKYLKDKSILIEIIEIYYKLLEKYYPNEFDEFKKNFGERLLEKFDGSSYENCVKYSKYRDILDNFLNYEDIIKFNIVIENGRYLNKRKISEIDIEYSDKERIKIAYWSSYKPIKKLSKVDKYTNRILPKNKKYINYQIDSLGFNDKKERYFRYNDNNIVVKLKDRKLKIFNSSGTEIKRLSSTKEDFYTVRTLANIKELKKMVKNVYSDGDKGIKKEYCNNVLRDYDLWREIYIDNVMLQEYVTKLIWEEVDSDDNIVGRFRYSEENNEFCDSNDDEYTINKENRIRLLSLDKISDDEVDRWREQLDDYEIVQPVPQLELYNIDYSDIDPKNVEISNREIELGKLEKNKIGLELKFKDEEMYFEIENILTIELQNKIKWTQYKEVSKDTIVKISKIKLLKNSDYSLRMVKLLKKKLGI